MKIFINNIPIKECKIDYTYTKHMIYSSEGILCNHNKKLTMMDTINNNVETIIKNNYTILIDNSKEIWLDYINYIPYDHIYCEEVFDKTHIGHDIFYIRHTYFDQVSHYFETERLEDYMYDTIFSFLLTN